MITKREARLTVLKYGLEILNSQGMELEKSFIQHGSTSVYEHSLQVAIMCVLIASLLPFKINHKSLVKGALLHDYFLYDWHIHEKWHKWHGFRHAGFACKNAKRDFEINELEENMISSHMFPMSRVIPKHRESIILCLSDKICATKEIIYK